MDVAALGYVTGTTRVQPADDFGEKKKVPSPLSEISGKSGL
jgi:hypothetical protein